MAYVLTLPDLGEGLVEAEIVQWHVEPGQWVSEGEPLVSVETDKAIFDIPAPATGYVDRLEVDEGARVSVGSRLVSISTDDRRTVGADTQRSPSAVPPLQSNGPPLQSKVGTGHVKATPRARKLARERGVDIDALGSALTDGPLTEADVVESQRISTKKIPRVSGDHRRLADHFARVQREVPAVTVVDECDFTILDQGVTEYARTAFILKVVSAALEDVPEPECDLGGR